MREVASASALTYARVQVAAGIKRGQIPERAERTREWLIAQLEEAGRTLQLLPARGSGPAGYGAGWPEVVHSAEEAYGWAAPLSRPRAPTAEEIARMDRAYAWIGLIPEGRRTWRRVVLMRSLVNPINERHVWTWRKIARAWGRNHEYWKSEWGKAISVMHRGILRGDA